jgi:hypothetical protein
MMRAVKIFLIILGAFLFLIGGACTVAGAVSLAVVGTDGWVQSGTDEVDVRGAALVSGTEEIEGESPGDDFPGDARLRVRAELDDGSAVFIGVARASRATAYLQGVPVDVVDDIEIDPTRLETDFVPGTETLESPAEQDFWLESVNGSGRQELDWEVESGAFRFVVAPVEPREGFVAKVSLGAKLPFFPAVPFVMLGLGILLLIAGVLLIVFGARRIGAPEPPAEPPAEPSAPTEPATGIEPGPSTPAE